MSDRRITVTFRFPKVLNQNIRAYAVQHDISQNEVAIKALSRFLTQEGADISINPRFFISRADRRRKPK